MFFLNSLHLPPSSFPFALISTWAQVQSSAFLLDLHLIHYLISILFRLSAWWSISSLASNKVSCFSFLTASCAQSLYYQKFLTDPIVVLIYVFLKTENTALLYPSNTLALLLFTLATLLLSVTSSILYLYSGWVLFIFFYPFLNTNVFRLQYMDVFSPSVFVFFFF